MSTNDIRIMLGQRTIYPGKYDIPGSSRLLNYYGTLLVDEKGVVMGLRVETIEKGRTTDVRLLVDYRVFAKPLLELLKRRRVG